MEIVTQQEFRVKGFIPIAIFSDRINRQLTVLFENDSEQAVGHETCAAWQTAIERWSSGSACAAVMTTRPEYIDGCTFRVARVGWRCRGMGLQGRNFYADRCTGTIHAGQLYLEYGSTRHCLFCADAFFTKESMS